LKQFFQQFVSCDSFLAEIWLDGLQDNLQKLPSGGFQIFSSLPTEMTDPLAGIMQWEGVPFQLLFQMPSPNLVAIPFW
jgi:hypothetical protein